MKFTDPGAGRRLGPISYVEELDRTLTARPSVRTRSLLESSDRAIYGRVKQLAFRFDGELLSIRIIGVRF